MKSTIYADETGNSGEHLLDPEQPVFALASNDFGAQEATELLAHVAVQKGSEPKFSTLKKTAAGEARLAKLLSDPRLNKTRVMVDWMHKPYMAVTKMVDFASHRDWLFSSIALPCSTSSPSARWCPCVWGFASTSVTLALEICPSPGLARATFQDASN